MPLPLDIHDRPALRVVRQLVEAILYEGLSSQPITIRSNTEFTWRLGEDDYRSHGKIGAFNRVRIVPDSVEILRDGRWVKAGLSQLVESLDAAPKQKLQLLTELERTAQLSALNDLQCHRTSRRELAFAELDSALDEGHPYHPCYKARTGFSDWDHLAYGPEAANTFQLVWLAVSRDLLHQSVPCDEETFWLEELGPEQWALLNERRLACGARSTSFGLIPLHPWQWNELKDTALSSWLAGGSAFFLGAAGNHYRASQSVRTLFNADNPHRASVKVAMNIINSSSRRTLEPHCVCTAPVISKWLEDIIESDPLFRSRYNLSILPEYAGIIAGRDSPLAGQVAAIWRQSINGLLEDGETAAPLNALMVMEKDGRPFIDDWIERYGLDKWLDRLIEVCVMPVWHLLVRHGIATEAHGQNMVLVHRNGWPERLVLRDFHDSVEYVPDFLADKAQVPDFLAINPAYRGAAPDTYYWMEDVESLGELVVDALFIYNLCEISHLLEHCYGLAETTFWAKLRARLIRYARDEALEERHGRLCLGRRLINTESLLSRKLDDRGRSFSHQVDNSLAPSGDLADAA